MANHYNYNNKQGPYFCAVFKCSVRMHCDYSSSTVSSQANKLPGELPPTHMCILMLAAPYTGLGPSCFSFAGFSILRDQN